MKARALPTIDFKALLLDFQNLNPRDVGTWPAAPRVAVLLGLSLTILLAGWWFVWVDQLADLDTKQRAELKLREEFLAKKREAVNLLSLIHISFDL